MITLHHLENSQSIRILWLLEELGIEYGFKMYDRDPKTMLAPDVYKSASPLGTAPFITDGDVSLAESNAIIDYILDHAPDQTLRPRSGDTDRADYLFWFHAAQGSYQNLQTMRFVHQIATDRSPGLLRPIIRGVMNKLNEAFIDPRIRTIMAKMEATLEERDFLAGQRFTAADIAMGYTLNMAKMRGSLTSAYPKTLAYVERMEARKGWQAALKKDGKFQGVPT